MSDEVPFKEVEKIINDSIEKLDSWGIAIPNDSAFQNVILFQSYLLEPTQISEYAGNSDIILNALSSFDILCKMLTEQSRPEDWLIDLINKFLASSKFLASTATPREHGRFQSSIIDLYMGLILRNSGAINITPEALQTGKGKKPEYIFNLPNSKSQYGLECKTPLTDNIKSIQDLVTDAEQKFTDRNIEFGYIVISTQNIINPLSKIYDPKGGPWNSIEDLMNHWILVFNNLFSLQVKDERNRILLFSQWIAVVKHNGQTPWTRFNVLRDTKTVLQVSLNDLIQKWEYLNGLCKINQMN